MKEILTDFQGWPVYARTLKELLLSIGGKLSDDGSLVIDNQEILEAYPIVLEDDGMGYGIFKGYITEMDHSVYDKKNGHGISRTFNIFIDKPDDFAN